MSRVVRRLLALALGLVAVSGLAFVGASWAHVPAPPTLARLLTTDPSEQGALFAGREVENAGAVRALPVAAEPVMPQDVAWKGERVAVADFLATTHTLALVVLREGEIHAEWYADGLGPADRLSSWSVAKSVVSLLAGQAIGDGLLSEDDLLVDVLPELRTGGEYDQITVKDLLDMSSGVAVAENYREWWPFTGTARLFLTTDLDGFLADHRELVFTPGEKADYRSVDTQLLGAVVAKVRGENLATLLGRDLWGPIGAETTALWNTDRVSGTEKAFCCLNATARDFARIGQLVLDEGRVEARQVVPQEWIERISTPSAEMGENGYSAQWWHWAGGSGDFSALGIHGQYVFVDPATSTVIVKLSDHGTEQDESETFAALRQIAAAGAP